MLTCPVETGHVFNQMKNPDLSLLDYLRHLAETLASTPHGAKEAVYRQAMEDLQCSRGSVFRHLQHFRQSQRKPRSDSGSTALTLEEAQAISELVLQSMRGNGKRLLTFADAIQIARDSGLVKASRINMHGQFSPLGTDAVVRALWRYGVHPDQLLVPTPHVRMASLHPNHVWQLDASVCVLYYLKDTAGVRLAAMEADQFYRNKPDNYERIANDRLMRYVITDHYSGTIYLQYVLGSESSENLARVFIDAIHPRDTSTDPFHGVPLHLVIDPGSANTGHLFTNLLRRLGVAPIVNKPRAPRAKGQVEGAHNIVERRFEGRLRFTGADSLDDLNEKAHVWMQEFNSIEIHRRHGRPRYVMWQTIAQEQLRLAPGPAICRAMLTTKPQLRRVRGDLTISFAMRGQRSRTYSVTEVPDVYVGKLVAVCVNPYVFPSINIVDVDAAGNERILAVCEPIVFSSAGFPVSAPVFANAVTARPVVLAPEVARAKSRVRAYGVERVEEAIAMERVHAIPTFGLTQGLKALPNGRSPVAFLPRPGVATGAIPMAVKARRLSLVKAALLLSQRMGDAWHPENFAKLAERYPDGVSEDEFDSLENWLRTRGDGRASEVA